MPQSRRGRGPRLAGSRVANTSLPRALAQSPRRAVRGAPASSHAQHLTRRRHSSEQVQEGSAPQADFRSEKWLRERAGGDAGNSRQAPRAEMASRDRSVPAVPLGRAAPCSHSRNSGPRAQRTSRSSRTGPLPPAPRSTWYRPPCNGLIPGATTMLLGKASGRARDGATSDWSVACHSVVSAARPILKKWEGSGGVGRYSRVSCLVFLLPFRKLWQFPPKIVSVVNN